MKRFLVTIIAILGISQSAAAEEVNCAMTSIEQYAPKDGTAVSTSVVRNFLHAMRVKTMDGDTEVYRTNGEMKNDVGQVMYTYRALRRTNSTTLPNGHVVEKSVVESTRVIEDSGKSMTSNYEVETEFEVLLDGTRKEIKTIQDGQELPQDGSRSFTVKALDGQSFESYSNDKPESFEEEDGTYTTLLTKQVCSSKP